jgi:hypothetical protein
MTKKQPHVPEMRETRPNRERRRHPERVQDHALSRDDPRAKNSGHKKKTADNWNQ